MPNITTFAEISTTPASNDNVNGIGIQGTNAVQNFDNAFRELMAILRRDVPGLALANTFTKTQTWTKGTDVASASSLTLGDGNYFDVTGTTTITSIGTKGVGTVAVLQFDAALTLTHNATDLILPSGANITTAAGDHAAFVEYATGDWRCFSYQRANGGPLVVPPENWVDVASATTTDIGAVASQNVRITGTTTITGLGTVAAGTFRRVRFADALTLTHNGTSLILPGAANITTAAGDVFSFISEGSGNWRCVGYQLANGRPLASFPFSAFYQSAEQTITSGGALTLAHGMGVEPKFITCHLVCKVAAAGYSVGDKVECYLMNDNGAQLNGATFWKDSTNVYLRFTSAGTVYTIGSKGGGARTGLTNSDWRLVVSAYA